VARLNFHFPPPLSTEPCPSLPEVFSPPLRHTILSADADHDATNLFFSFPRFLFQANFWSQRNKSPARPFPLPIPRAAAPNVPPVPVSGPILHLVHFLSFFRQNGRAFYSPFGLTYRRFGVLVSFWILFLSHCCPRPWAGQGSGSVVARFLPSNSFCPSFCSVGSFSSIGPPRRLNRPKKPPPPHLTHSRLIVGWPVFRSLCFPPPSSIARLISPFSPAWSSRVMGPPKLFTRSSERPFLKRPRGGTLPGH